MNLINKLHNLILKEYREEYDLLVIGKCKLIINLCVVFFSISLFVSIVILFFNPDPLTVALRLHVPFLMLLYLFLLKKGYSYKLVAVFFILHLFMLLSFLCLFVVNGNYTAGLMFVLLVLLSNYLVGKLFPWLIFIMSALVLVSSVILPLYFVLPSLHTLPFPVDPKINLVFFIIILMLFVNMLEIANQNVINGLNNVLQVRLNERETLLKEIHHRVKNNLQVIMSLLSLQTAYINDEEVIRILNQSQYRIGSMAATHEMLYQSGDFAKVEYEAYLNQLTQNLINSIKGKNSNIEYVIEVNNIYFKLDTAIPLGLMINEILTNSLKYAFSKNEKGIITIRINELNDKRLKLEIGDNGKGFSPSDRRPKSIGLKLIHKLSYQLEGGIVKDNTKKGTNYIIEFSRVN
jgi:two-component sensor histidine kinase